MTLVTTGIVVDGTLQLREPLELPNETPVNVTIQPLSPADGERLAAWERTLKRLAERPIHGGGKRYTRDELHERR
jgi:hypothetical protein